MSDSQLKSLENKIDQLIALCQELNRENQRLKADNSGWQKEREILINMNALAKSKVEAAINRLRMLEQSS